MQKFTLKDQKRKWLSQESLRKRFNIDPKKDVYDNESVKRFINQLNRIPIQETYTLVGYGSLLNANDIPRTLPSAQNHRLGILFGYKRIFNIGFDTAYLNVVPDDEIDIEVAIVEFEHEHLPDLIQREALYDFEEVEVYDVEDEKAIKALMVIGDEYYENNLIEPQLNYLHLCLSGASELNELKGINNFLDTSFCYSPYHANTVSVRNYLSKLNTINYMVQHRYSSR